jgi:hypothetical protein
LQRPRAEPASVNWQSHKFSERFRLRESTSRHETSYKVPIIRGSNKKTKRRTLAPWTPDPTFYPSPRMAMACRALAYVASFDPKRRVQDRITNLVLFANFVPIPFTYLSTTCVTQITIHPSVKNISAPSLRWRTARIAPEKRDELSIPAPQGGFPSAGGRECRGRPPHLLHPIAGFTGDVSSRVFA